MNMAIPENDFGKFYIFEVTGPPTPGLVEKTPEDLQAVFGHVYLDPTYVDVISIEGLGGLALSDYLHQGYDIPIDDLDVSAIDQINGTAIVILSRAFGGQSSSLEVNGNVRHVTTAAIAPPITLSEAAEYDAAQRSDAPVAKNKKKSDAAMSGRIATITLLVLFALVALMVWISG